MADSSVNAPAKKDGAGGSYTWGSAGDDPTDYIIGGEVIGPNVTTVTLEPAVVKNAAPAQPFVGNLADNRAFPSLSGVIKAQPAASGVVQVPTMAPGARAWPASSAPKVVLSAEQLRPGTADIFDSSHPRNVFATRPTTSTPTVVQSVGPQMAIDWSSSGIPLEVNRSIIQAGNAAHLGLYQQPSSGYKIPANYLRPTTAPMAPKVSYRVQAQSRPQVVKQSRGQLSRGQKM